MEKVNKEWWSKSIIFLFFILIMPLSAGLPLEIRFSEDGRQLITGGNKAEGFYDQSIIRTINLQFDDSNYWQKLVSGYTSGTEVPATISIDGIENGRVGVKFRGETSYMMNMTQKKSFAISVDYDDPENTLMGYKTLNLNCGYLDQSSIREVLYNEFCRKHLPNAKANYIWLQLNGVDWGLYHNIQQLNGDFIKEWFQSSDGTRWRCEGIRNMPPGSLVPEPPGNNFGAGKSSFNYLGDDTSLYVTNYTLKKAHKENPWEDLVKTCSVLNNVPLDYLEAELNKVMDVDRALWFLAHEIVFTDDDGYVNKGGTDYYAYWEAETGRLTPLEYDGNTCMARNLATTWSIFQKENDVKYPLMNRLFKVPALRQRYLAHVRTIIAESMQPAYIDSIINAYFNFISPYVQKDPKKIYSYNQFNSSKQSLIEFFTSRRNYLLNNAEVKAFSPIINKVDFYSNDVLFRNPLPGEKVKVVAEASGPDGINSVWLYFSNQLTGAFSKMRMLDDGTNGDEKANDGFYSAYLPGFQTGNIIRFYVEAVSGNSAKTVVYSPEGAEHNVYFFSVEPKIAASEDVVINEFMASNSKTAKDQDGEYDDWIELFNNSGKTLDLSGYFLSDKSDNITKWVFPKGTSISPYGYLIVWADENGKQEGLHANFKLSASGEEIYLSKPDTTVIQSIVFGEQKTDWSSSRIPNGKGDFVIKTPTFATNNESDVSVDESRLAENSFKIYPNPSNDGKVNIERNFKDIANIYVINTLGIKVFELEISDFAKMDLSSLPQGVYYVVCGNYREKLVLTK